MSQNNTLQDWENLVAKQLKTDDIYNVLTKENLEGIVTKPYYNQGATSFRNLPKIEESTQLVAAEANGNEDDIYAFLYSEANSNFLDKSFYIDKNFEKEVNFKSENRYLSLIDVFNDEEKKSDAAKYSLNKNLADKLLNQPFSRAICIDISLHQNSGAAIYQQLGIALAKTKEFSEIYGAEILPKLIFRIAVGANYFFEIAKIRALKLIFNQFSKEFGLDILPYIFAETSQRNKTKNDAENNLIRSTLELASAMIGGADAVFTNDYKLESSTELSREISFKQQIILAYESIINVFDDAGNGSFFIENITQQLAKKSWELFIEIEEAGGYISLLNEGFVQRKIYEHALEEQKWVENDKIKLIGANLYPKQEATKSAEEMYSELQIRPVRWSEMYE